MTWIPVRGILAGKEILEEYGPEAIDRLAMVRGKEHESHIRNVLASGLAVGDCLKLPGEPDIVLPSRLSVSTITAIWAERILPRWPAAVWGPLGDKHEVRSNRLNYRAGDRIAGLTLSTAGIASWRDDTGGTDGMCPSMAIYRR